MNYVLDHTGKPYAKLFEDISAIPRGSFKEEKIADFVCNFAKDLGLEYTRDSANNIIVRKPASPGYEGCYAPGTHGYDLEQATGQYL